MGDISLDIDIVKSIYRINIVYGVYSVNSVNFLEKKIAITNENIGIIQKIPLLLPSVCYVQPS